MSEQRIVVETHMCVCGQNHTASDLDKLDEVCPAYRARIVELPDMEKLREAVAWWDEYKGFVWQCTPDQFWAATDRTVDAARWVLGLESE